MYEEIKDSDVGKDLQGAYNQGFFDGMMCGVKCLKATREMVLKLDASIADILKFIEENVV